jgi:hypothetical protein
MTEENKTIRDSLIKDLKSDRERLQKAYRKLELGYDDLCEKYNDLQNAFEESCEHRQLLFTRYADAYSEGFKNGQEDFQVKVKKILDTFDKWEADELVDVFGVTTNIELLNDIKTNYEKIINYEKKKEEIHVGDVVKNVGIEKPLLVYKVASPYVYILDQDGQGSVRSEKDVVKTGKHYPIDEILKELE